jgi:hypothetical protein
VTPKPGIEDNNILRIEFPKVCPKPGTRGSISNLKEFVPVGTSFVLIGGKTGKDRIADISLCYRIYWKVLLFKL